FCRAEGDGDYATAYGLLSQPVQQRVSLATFTQVSRNTILVSCSANHGIPIIFGGARPRLHAHYDLSDSNGFDAAMTFVREQDEWRAYSMSPARFELSPWRLPRHTCRGCLPAGWPGHPTASPRASMVGAAVRSPSRTSPQSGRARVRSDTRGQRESGQGCASGVDLVQWLLGGGGEAGRRGR